MSKILLPMFSSRIFMVLGLTFKSLIHFEFILVYGIRRWSHFIFRHLSVHFAKQHLLSKLSLAHWCACFLCWILIDHIYVGLFLGSLFCSTDICVYFHVLITMALYSLILGSVIPTALLFFLRIAVAMRGLLCFQISFWNILVLCNMWNTLCLEMNCIESIDCFW